MGYRGELLRIEQIAIANPESTLVEFGLRRMISENDYLFGHCNSDSSTSPEKATRRHPEG